MSEPAPPCPYCGTTAPETADVCASCGKPLLPLPHLKQTQTQNLFRTVANVVCSFIFVVASVSAAYTFLVIFVSLSFAGYPDPYLIPGFISLLLVATFSYYGHARFRQEPPANSSPR